MNGLDLFAGPGGWDVAAAELGIDVTGVEFDEDACATRAAAGHRTVQGDVAALDPLAFAPAEVLIGSPPCPTFSRAGKRSGTGHLAQLAQAAGDLARGRPVALAVDDPRTALVLEPLRYALALQPRAIALEQVPDVLPLWRVVARELERLGWSTWCGELNAADYGVPQTRRRAILIACRDGRAGPPPPTHSRYGAAFTLTDGQLEPWVTMAAALGWDGCVGFPRRGERDHERDTYRARDLHPTDRPAPVVTEKARSWWVTRPATTVCGDPRIWAPGHKSNGDDVPGRYQGRRGDDAIRVELDEAAVLQGFPRGYPWRGTKTSRFQQVGNAVPPPLARAVLRAAVTDAG